MRAAIDKNIKGWRRQNYCLVQEMEEHSITMEAGTVKCFPHGI